MAESKEELKSLLKKVKESEKVGLKLNIQKTKIMAFSPITLWQTDGKQWKQWQTLFSWAPKSLQMVTAARKLKDVYSLEEKLWPTKTAYDKADITLPTKVHLVKAMVFPVVIMDVRVGLKESWVLKNWCFWTVEKTLDSHLDSKEIQPVHPKRNQSWIFIGKTDAEASILWPPDVKSWVVGKDPDAGKG